MDPAREFPGLFFISIDRSISVDKAMTEADDKIRKCEWCEKDFTPTYLQLWKHRKGQSAHLFCSRPCRVGFYRNQVEMPCAQCGTSVTRPQSELRKSKSGNIFCSPTCSTIFGNYTSKKQITNSAIERYFQEQIKKDFPDLKVDYNSNDAIGCELDIYFPEYRIGIECHGPFHYRPILGGYPRFLKTLANDIRKAQMAKDACVLLFVINISGARGKKAQNRYYPQIKKIIEAAIGAEKD